MEFIRMKDLREYHHYTQMQVAAYVGITRRTYSNYESGKTKIPVKVLIKLSDYYHISVDYLVDFTDDPIPHKRRRTE